MKTFWCHPERSHSISLAIGMVESKDPYVLNVSQPEL